MPKPETEGYENSTRTALILKEFSASGYLCNCLRIIIHLADFSLVKQKIKKQTTPIILPKEESVLFTSFMAVTEKEDEENQVL